MRYGHLVLGLCFKYFKNKEDSKEAVFQIFEKLINDLRKHNISFFKSWLYVYSKNYCLMQLRKKQKKLSVELEINENTMLVLDYNSSDHLIEKENQINNLEAAIEQLNDVQKNCIKLFFLENKSYKEIVALTGYSENEVKSNIQNGKRNLKLKLEDVINGK
ncbi:MAG: sigma-70 family RNA polymerase sigma factor [Bacteroidetes bacterium]|nr:sigma-70 family RNA polymerase sigma factor [Bacteroidota bacterium]